MVVMDGNMEVNQTSTTGTSGQSVSQSLAYGCLPLF